MGIRPLEGKREREKERGGRSLPSSTEKILSSLRVLICLSSMRHNIVVIISLDLHIIWPGLSDPWVCECSPKNGAFSHLLSPRVFVCERARIREVCPHGKIADLRYQEWPAKW